MRLLVLIVAILAGVYLFKPDTFAGLTGLLSQYRITEQDPLGVPELIKDALENRGFRLSSGSVNDDDIGTFVIRDQHYDTESTVKIWVGEEAFVYKIAGTFASSQHGMSPGPMTRGEGFMREFWREIGAGTPRFQKHTEILGEVMGVRLKDEHKRADFENELLSCKWLYSNDYPMEVAICETN